MQVQIISGSRTQQTTSVVANVTAGLKKTDNGYPMVYATAYAIDGLLAILEVRYARGEQEILVLECSREQIQAVLEWQSCMDGEEQLEGLILHLVRSEPTEKTTN
ncbi:hypothetical protein D3C77_106570 [compost metagenome]